MRSRLGVPVVALVALALLAASLLGAASASAAGVVNGDFETGTLAGWQTHYQTGEGEWFAGNAKKAEEEGLAPPPSGSFAAMSYFKDVDSAILYQDVALPAASTSTLSMYLYYVSGAPIVVPSPNTLILGKTSGAPTPAEENQQVRVDVIRPTAPIISLSPSDILATVYASKTGDPKELGPTQLTADLTPFAGRTVRLRIATVAREFYLSTGVDGVAITSAPIPTPAPAPVAPVIPTPPSNQIKKGALKLNKKNGTAALAITVPGAGTLTEMDASTKVAIASMTSTASKGAKGGHKPMLIKTATLHPTAAGTIKVPIKPTASGRRVLGEKGKLRIRARLTFTPSGGTAATRIYRATLVKTLKPRK